MNLHTYCLSSMKVYEAVYTDIENQGIYALSVVENPAMEDQWITLAEHPKEMQFSTIDQEKRLLLGAALIPNKKIYRNIDGNEFYVTFKEDTIEKLAHDFFRKNMQNNSTLEHEVKLNGMSVVEGWIVEDPKKDKSNHYGKEYPKGTFVTMMKVDNDEMWQKAKSGEITGFSIDALLGLQELKLKTEIKMTEEVKKSIVDEVIDGVKALFSSEKKVEEVEVGEEVIASEAKNAEVVDKSTEAMKAQLEELVARFDKQEKSLETIKAELSKSEEEKKKAEDKVEELTAELNKQPEVEAVTLNPEVKSNEVKFKYATKRRETMKDRVLKGLGAMAWDNQ